MTKITQPIHSYYPDVKRYAQYHRHECFLSTSLNATWFIEFHDNFRDDNKYVFGNDLVLLQHCEDDGYLSADYQYNSSCSELFLRTYDGDYHEEHKSVSSMWEIEFLNPPKGLPIETHRSTFKLRHFLTGKVLGIKQISLEGKMLHIPILCEDGNEVLFRSTLGDDDGKVLNHSNYLIEIDGK